MNDTMFNTKAVHWLAGILEGEGCFMWVRNRGNWFGPRVVVKMTDLDVITRCLNVFGIGVIYGPHGPYPSSPNSKPTYSWAVEKTTDAIGLMMTMYPLLLSRRQEKIRSILSQWQKYERKAV